MRPEDIPLAPMDVVCEWPGCTDRFYRPDGGQLCLEHENRVQKRMLAGKDRILPAGVAINDLSPSMQEQVMDYNGRVW